MWAHYLAILAAFLAVAVIIGTAIYSHAAATGEIYAAAVTGWQSSFTPAEKDEFLDVAREGARWANSLHCETTLWAVAILVLLVVVLGVDFWRNKL
jgi:hypothetical protein